MTGASLRLGPGNYGLSISDVLQSEDGDVDPGGGGHKYKKDEDAPEKFWSLLDPLRDTKILFCGRGLKLFPP